MYINGSSFSKKKKFMNQTLANEEKPNKAKPPAQILIRQKKLVHEIFTRILTHSLHSTRFNESQVHMG